MSLCRWSWNRTSSRNWIFIRRWQGTWYGLSLLVLWFTYNMTVWALSTDMHTTFVNVPPIMQYYAFKIANFKAHCCSLIGWLVAWLFGLFLSNFNINVTFKPVSVLCNSWEENLFVNDSPI
jgi:hypothetical protein